jgi:hypothetical protein
MAAAWRLAGAGANFPKVPSNPIREIKLPWHISTHSSGENADEINGIFGIFGMLARIVTVDQQG